MNNKLVDKFGYKKVDSKHYYLNKSEILYNFPNNKCVSVDGKIYRIELLEAIVNARPKNYAGRRAIPIPEEFKEDCATGITYPELMKKYNVARKTIAKWKRAIK